MGQIDIENNKKTRKHHCFRAFVGVCLTFGREDRIRTCDPLVPNQVRYRPALLPELFLTGGEGGIRTLGTV